MYPTDAVAVAVVDAGVAVGAVAIILIAMVISVRQVFLRRFGRKSTMVLFITPAVVHHHPASTAGCRIFMLHRAVAESARHLVSKRTI